MPKKIFDMIIFFCLCLWSLSGVFGVDEVKSVSVTEGESVTLNPDAVIQTADLIMWSFGHSLVAKIYRQNNKTDVSDERFRDRLKLDHQTGSLTIMNTRTTDSGLYTVTSTKSLTLSNLFNLTVYAPLPVPVISNNSLQNYLSSCSLVCSVVNVSDVTLSWYKGNSMLSSVSVSDLRSPSDLSLHLECLDDSYSCVVNNPISNQTLHLNTQLCQPCSEASIHCCGFTEAVIRLALSALVGVATVAVLVYDIRSRSLQQKKREQMSPSNSDLSDTQESGDVLE